MLETHEELRQQLDDKHANMLRQTLARSRRISVGVVGAGFAGLRCADLLTHYGMNVTILEARDRLGGRVAQSDSLGHKVDLGPNWIHGSDNNPVMRIAQHTKTILHNWPEEAPLLYDFEGKLIDKAEAAEYGHLLWDDGLIAQAFAHSSADRETIDPELDLASFLRDQAEQLFRDLPKHIAKSKRARLLQYAALWGAYVGSDYDRQSLRNFWLEECIEGENPFVAETYCRILDAVASPAKERAQIRLNTIVKQIQHQQEPAPKGAGFKTAALTSEGETLAFDEIVVTSPLGWLKRNKSSFQPPLSSRLASAIDNIGYGCLDKIYVSFPAPFWMTSLESKPPGMMQWLEPSYSRLNPQGWVQLGMNLAALPAETAQPTLLFYIFGDCAAHVGSLVRSSASKATADAKLIEFIQPYYSLLPNFDTSKTDCHPTGILATAWINDEFAGYGSYSNFQIPLVNGAEDIEVMRQGMPDGGLWLAGEHTAPFVAMGTSTGAYWSGEAVAQRIIQAHGLEKVESSTAGVHE